MMEGHYDLSAQDRLKVIMTCGSQDDQVLESVEKEFKTLVDSIIFIKKKSEAGFEGLNTL